MEAITVHHRTNGRLPGTTTQVLVGVVASGNLEILAERHENDRECTIEIATAAEGFGEVWRAVIADFVERADPGGVRFSVNDGGARPDTVMLRLLQAARVLGSAPTPEPTPAAPPVGRPAPDGEPAR